MSKGLEIQSFQKSAAGLAAQISACEALHLQLRPDVEQPYVQHIEAIMAEGARLAIGRVDGEVCCLALYRIFKTTLGGPRLYVDDLVTDARMRGQKYGEQLLHWVEDEARSEGCSMATLESGVQRADAHRFYFRSGYAVTAFSFEKAI